MPPVKIVSFLSWIHQKDNRQRLRVNALKSVMKEYGRRLYKNEGIFQKFRQKIELKFSVI